MNEKLEDLRIQLLASLGGLLNTIEIAIENKDKKTYASCRQHMQNLLEDYIEVTETILSANL